MGRDVEYPLNAALESNLAKLLQRLNAFRSLYGLPMYVSSGYRPGKYNKAAGGAKTSAHLSCEACDFKDDDGKLKAFIAAHPGCLEDCDLYMEAPIATPTWVHLQTRKTTNRIFKP